MHLRFKHRADAEAVVAVAVGSITSGAVKSEGDAADGEAPIGIFPALLEAGKTQKIRFLSLLLKCGIVKLKPTRIQSKHVHLIFSHKVAFTR